MNKEISEDEAECENFWTSYPMASNLWAIDKAENCGGAAAPDGDGTEETTSPRTTGTQLMAQILIQLN